MFFIQMCKTRSCRLHSKVGMAHSVCWVEAGTCVEKVDSVDSHSKVWQQAVQLLDEGFQFLDSLANTGLVRSPPATAPCLHSVNFGVEQHFCTWVFMQKANTLEMSSAVCI